MKRLELLVATGLILFSSSITIASETVTVDNFVRAETDMTLGGYVKQGALGTFLHIRNPTPIDKQNVIRMNRDTIYSFGVFDLTEPVTIVKPDSRSRFQSMKVVNQDHYTLEVEYGQGEFTYTKDKVGSRYVCIIFRTFINANDQADVKAANAMQDKIQARTESPGSL